MTTTTPRGCAMPGPNPLPLTSGCSVDDCTRSSNALESVCRFHRILRDARWLAAEDLDLLRELLADVVVLSEEEQRSRRLHSRLRWVSSQSRALEFARRSAVEAGADTEQLNAAIAAGIDREAAR